MASHLALENRSPTENLAAGSINGNGTCPTGNCPILFRDFKVFARDRTLYRGDEIVPIGGRAFDLLVALLRARGSILTKDQIVQEVWPRTFVDESNLRFQMACLRRTLGDDRDVIKTVQGRGYLFLLEGAEPPPLENDAPLRDDHSVEAERGRGSPHHAGEGHVIAIVDDDDDTLDALHGLLRSAGFAVESFSSVQGFLESAHRADIGCLVLDVCMPGRSGLELQADLADSESCLPIIFISGHADVHMSVRAMKAGAVEFLTKPVRYQDLLDAVHCATTTALH